MVVKHFSLGEITVTTAGTRVQVTSIDTPVAAVWVQAHPSNTGAIYVGNETVDSTHGIILHPGRAVEFTPPEIRGNELEFILSDFYLDAETNGDSAIVWYIKRRL